MLVLAAFVVSAIVFGFAVYGGFGGASETVMVVALAVFWLAAAVCWKLGLFE
jgi:hypothetical protein